VAGEFAYYSTDEQGFRQATLVGGTILYAPGIRLSPAKRERTGTVVEVDYLGKTIWLDQIWPMRETSNVFEIGVAGHKTAYTAVNIVPEGDRTRIAVKNGADYFRAPILDVNPEESTATCALGLTMGARPGIDRDWVASNDDMTVFWNADVVDDKTFRLTATHGQTDKLDREAFGKAGVLRLWEYGVGDKVRQSTVVSIRRIDEKLYELKSDVDVEVHLPGEKLEISQDKTNWRSARIHRSDGLMRFLIRVEDLSPTGNLYMLLTQ
jgi:hypothetical protein